LLTSTGIDAALISSIAWLETEGIKGGGTGAVTGTDVTETGNGGGMKLEVSPDPIGGATGNGGMPLKPIILEIPAQITLENLKTK